MQKYIALLRAINVGGHNVKMADLRTLFEALELANVETFIASGNVIFDAQAEEVSALEQRIERHLRAALGYEVATFIRTPAELAATAAHQPFAPASPDAPDSSLYVAFLRELPGAAAQRNVLDLRTPIDDFQFHGRELYWFCRTKISQSSLFSGAVLEKAIRMPATMRNITTVRKLAAKYPPS
jgi:uncharacterized protein (DUF1697 family)